MKRIWNPDVGDLIFADSDPQAGHEQAGVRPALVFSPSSYNQISQSAIVCPITRQAKGYPFEVELPAGMKAAGVILSDQVKSIDWMARPAKLAGKAPREIVEAVKQHLDLLIGFR